MHEFITGLQSTVIADMNYFEFRLKSIYNEATITVNIQIFDGSFEDIFENGVIKDIGCLFHKVGPFFKSLQPITS